MKIVFIQEIIDVIRGKIFGLPSTVNKYECYKRARNYHTIALGSSHMEHSYIPSAGEINMGSASQDLYYSYNLYKIMNCEDVKRVLITFSVFTPGDFLIKSGVNKMCIMFKLLYGIPYQDENIAKKCKFKLWENYYKKNIEKYQRSIDLPNDYNGILLSYDTKETVKNAKEIEERALKHYKIGCKQSKNMEYCHKLLEDTKKCFQKIYFILPPATDFYKSPLPSSDIIFKELYKLCQNYPNAKIINYYDSKDFSVDDFIDGDHLNGNGCRKFTRMLNDFISTEK